MSNLNCKNTKTHQLDLGKEFNSFKWWYLFPPVSVFLMVSRVFRFLLGRLMMNIMHPLGRKQSGESMTEDTKGNGQNPADTPIKQGDVEKCIHKYKQGQVELF